METTSIADRIGFWYHAVDVRSLLPSNWRQEIEHVVLQHATSKTISPTSVTSRESDASIKLPVLTVGGRFIRSHLPWLDTLYRQEFLQLAQSVCSEIVVCATDERYAININIQRGTKMRYECHVDSNPIEGLLYASDLTESDGGSLVVSSSKSATNIADVDSDPILIYPRAGTLVFFDARKHSHYVRSLKQETATRLAVAMNFYTKSCSEADRPSDLNRHLGIE